MNRRILLSIIALLMLLPVTAALYAQDLSQTASEFGITINYPSDWFSVEDDEGLAVINLDVDPDELEGAVPPEAIAVTVAPPDTIGMMVDAGSTPVEALEVFAGFLSTDAEIEELTVGSYPAARLNVGNEFLPDTNANGTLYVLDVDGALVFAVIIYGENYSSEPEIGAQILATITVDPSVVFTPEEPSEPVELGDPDTPLVYGDSVGGELTNRETQQVWTFSGTAGDVVTITMIATEDDFALDTRLYLYTLEGFDGGDDAIAENDDASNPEVSGFNSQIEAFELPEDGEYIIVATRFGDGTGRYTLSLEEGGLSRADRAEAATAITYGEEVTGEINSDSPSVLYRFEGTTGDVITITLIAEDTDDLDPTLALYTLDQYTANGFPTMSNDDAFETEGLGLNSEIFEFELYEDGIYIIEASSFGSGDGEYTLTLESSK